MKSPLMYQLIEESAGEVAIFNCISFLYDREEMPLEFLKIMSSYSISCYDEQGLPSNADFCENLLLFASSWLKDFAKEKHISLYAKYLTKDGANLLEIRKCLLSGGCVCLKTGFARNHYLTITKMDGEYIYIFDPTYKPDDFKLGYGAEVVLDEPFSYNRKVLIEKFVSEKSGEYTLGAEKNREMILFYRTNAVLEREFVD